MQLDQLTDKAHHEGKKKSNVLFMILMFNSF